MIHDPDLLILDEPTTGVDPLARRQFWELIDRIRARRSGMSVMVATAYMDEAERFDWLIAMNAGKVLATGSSDELKRDTNETTLERAFIQLLPEEVAARPQGAGDLTLAIHAAVLQRSRRTASLRNSEALPRSITSASASSAERFLAFSALMDAARQPR